MEAAVIVFVITWVFFWFNIRGRKIEFQTSLAEKQKKLDEVLAYNTRLWKENKQLRADYDELKEQQNTLIDLIDESESIEKLKALLFESEEEEGSYEEQKIVIPEKSKPKIYQTFYFLVPNKNGTFSDSNNTAFNAARHMYQFTILNEQGTKARFKFINHELTTKDALTDPQRYLRPVCTYENAITARSKQIITVEEGWADKEDNIWTVTQKAMIHFD
ncbi:hypothetical protein [Emticicia sp. C21]|uniref:hypothetical protein n=1 Tax=Emticicia sp. C21 TaxID=2302915 RepID=UPI000E344B99|nr:hypothetical protein [Emticicia sp. C21]RFS14946.1 hypothetical protein D0T08_17825 [Emticicia sp. C21]